MNCTYRGILGNDPPCPHAAEPGKVRCKAHLVVYRRCAGCGRPVPPSQRPDLTEDAVGRYWDGKCLRHALALLRSAKPSGELPDIAQEQTTP